MMIIIKYNYSVLTLIQLNSHEIKLANNVAYTLKTKAEILLYCEDVIYQI